MVIFLIALMPILKVNAASTNLLVEKVWSDPEVISPGEKFNLNFTLKNLGSKDLEKITLKIVSVEGKNTLTGFSPIGGTNDIYLNNLAKNESTDVNISLLADTQLKAGAYNLIIAINGKEKNGSNFEDSKIVGVVVANKPKIAITSSNIADEKIASKKKLTVDFANAGKGTVYNVMVTVNTNDKQQSKYFASVEPTDENTYEQVIEVTEAIKGKINITYEDELNRSSSITKDFEIEGPKTVDKNVVSSDKEKKGFFSSVGKFFKRLLGLGE
jgi:uncharacterized membrane protein